MAGEIEVLGTNGAALFSLKVHRGDGMALLGMDWIGGRPPNDFVGFSIEYLPPGSAKFLALGNRLTFATPPANVGANPNSTLFAPIQKFRWVHFPFDPERPGEYRLPGPASVHGRRPELSWGDAQEAGLELRRETYPGISTSPSRAASSRPRPSSTGTRTRGRSRRSCPRRRRRPDLRAHPPEDQGRARVDGFRGAERDPGGSR